MLEIKTDALISLDPMLGFAVGAIFIGGLSRGFAGFGAALIIVPALTLVYGPVPAVVIMSLIEVPGALQLARTAARDADWNNLAPLCFAAAVTIPIGAWALAVLDVTLIRQSIAGIVIVFGAMIATGWHYNGEVTTGLSAAIGAVSGFCSGIASLGGPPVVMFLIAQGSNASQTRAGIIAYFAFATALRLAIFAIFGLLSVDALLLSLLLSPVYMCGIWVGKRTFRGISETVFRRFVVALVLVMGMIELIN
tara:strand:- start:518 stop:1270 length:753 start_codon:yes stop_codon:yes gene_type:complete